MSALCPIHAPAEGEGFYCEPTEDDLIDELVQHLNGACDEMCGHCYDEWDVRTHGIESVTAYDRYLEQLVRDECTCAA